MVKLEFTLVIFAVVPLKLPPLNSAELTILVKTPLAAVIVLRLRLVVFKLVKLPFVKLALVPLTIVEVIRSELMLSIVAVVPLNKLEFTVLLKSPLVALNSLVIVFVKLALVPLT